jgi:predicted nucleic acid-binding protein
MNKLKVFLDSDIILDVLLEREEFYQPSAKILDLGVQKKMSLFTSSISITNIGYILRKELKSSKKAMEYIKNLMEIIKILAVTEDVILKALKTDFNDFEDSIQYIVAKMNNVDFLVTRNTKDYRKAKIQVLDSISFLESHGFI